MLIDYVSPEKLPMIICWLDWNFYSNKPTLLFCIVIMNVHYIYWILSFPSGKLILEGFILPSFVGFCLWVFYLAISEGYGVG